MKKTILYLSFFIVALALSCCSSSKLKNYENLSFYQVSFYKLQSNELQIITLFRQPQLYYFNITPYTLTPSYIPFYVGEWTITGDTLYTTPRLAIKVIGDKFLYNSISDDAELNYYTLPRKYLIKDKKIIDITDREFIDSVLWHDILDPIPTTTKEYIEYKQDGDFDFKRYFKYNYYNLR